MIFSSSINYVNNFLVIIMFLAFLPNIHCIPHNITKCIIPISYIIIPISSIVFWNQKPRYSYDNIILSTLWILFLFWALTISLINGIIINRIYIGYTLTILINIFVVTYPYSNLVLQKLATISMLTLPLLITVLAFDAHIFLLKLKIHPNSLALFFVLITIALAFRFNKNLFLYTIIVIFNLFIIAYYTKSRSAILMLASYLLFYLLWPSLTKGRFIRPWLIFHLFILLSLAIPILIIYADTSEYAPSLNEISRKMTTKNFFSGRERIWNAFFDVSVSKIILGEGLKRYSQTNSTTLSLHNAWLNLLRQVGVIGLLLFLGILIFIWKGLLARKLHYSSRIAASFLASFILQQNFEISLFQNNLGISLWLWIIIGLALAQPLHSKFPANRSG